MSAGAFLDRLRSANLAGAGALRRWGSTKTTRRSIPHMTVQQLEQMAQKFVTTRPLPTFCDREIGRRIRTEEEFDMIARERAEQQRERPEIETFSDFLSNRLRTLLDGSELVVVCQANNALSVYSPPRYLMRRFNRDGFTVMVLDRRLVLQGTHGSKWGDIMDILAVEHGTYFFFHRNAEKLSNFVALVKEYQPQKLLPLSVIMHGERALTWQEAATHFATSSLETERSVLLQTLCRPATDLSTTLTANQTTLLRLLGNYQGGADTKRPNENNDDKEK